MRDAVYGPSDGHFPTYKGRSLGVMARAASMKVGPDVMSRNVTKRKVVGAIVMSLGVIYET